MNSSNPQDTICALSTPPGIGALGVIRLTGSTAVAVAQRHFSRLMNAPKFPMVCFGAFKNEEEFIDEVVVTVFRGPASFTGEDTVEISCHGSPYIQQRIINALLQSGARMAEPGEFTLRAFLNGKMDLSQAEAVADLIAAQGKAAHQLALQQMRGGFSKEIEKLRERLIHFASMIELELDFSEEDVEFADRDDLKKLVDEIREMLRKLVDSFETGNVLKNGVPVAITGAPNQGKSTLLNALLNDDRAIVSATPGTTRDVIEDEITLGGVRYRFIDTAGIRDTTDEIETMGIAKTIEKANAARIILYLVDAVDSTREEILAVISTFRQKIDDPNKELIIVANKMDKPGGEDPAVREKFSDIENVVFLSALTRENLSALQEELLHRVNTGAVSGEEVVVTNARHHDALRKALQSLNEVREGLDKNITGDFLATDIRKALHHLGEITGKITTDDLLGNIFSKFCIGK